MPLSRAPCTFLVVAALIACGGGGGSPKTSDEPQTAREKQLLEARKSGEIDDPKAKSWGTWSYTGDKQDCFYVIGRRCFKTKKAACNSLACGKKGGKKCNIVGGGPATVSCK
jgi:hypothetical protein